MPVTRPSVSVSSRPQIASQRLHAVRRVPVKPGGTGGSAKRRAAGRRSERISRVFLIVGHVERPTPSGGPAGHPAGLPCPGSTRFRAADRREVLVGYGLGVFLLAIGLILALAVQDSISAVDLTL